MAKVTLKSEYVIEKKCEAFFTGQHVEVTPDAKYMFCQCADSVTVVNINEGNVVKKVELEEAITCISLSPNSQSFLVALQSSSIQHYDYRGPDKGPILLRSFKSYHQGPVRCMAWDSTSSLVASGSSDGSARIWDIHNKFCTHSLKGASGVFSLLRFDELKSRPWIFGACGVNIYIWLLEAGSSKIVATLENHNSPITGMEVCQSRDKLISCGLDRVIILWDLVNFVPIKVVPVFESLSGLALKPPGFQFLGYADGEEELIYAMVVGDKGVPSLWEVSKGREVWKASEPLVQPTDQEGVSLVNQITVIPSIDSFLFAIYDNSILFTKFNTMEVWKQFSGFNEEIIDLIFVGSSDSHLVVATNSNHLSIYNCQSMDCKLVRGHSGIVMALARHPSYSEIFASCSGDNTARLWRLLSDGSALCVGLATGHTHSVGSIAIGEEYLVTGSKDTCIKKWDLSKKLMDKLLITNSVTNLESSSTDKAHIKDINTISVSRNSRFIATGSQDKSAKIYESSDLSLIGTLLGHKRGIWCCQFSPVDQIIATASADGTVKIWTLSNFTNAMTLEGHSASVLRLQFVTNGLQIVSTGADGLLKLWTLKGGVCANTFEGHEGKTWALAVAGDEGNSGAHIVSGGEDASLIWWKDVTEEEKQKKVAEVQKLASQEQTLLNLIHNKKWTKAFKISIALNQPFRALKIAKQILDESPDIFKKLLTKLKENEIASLLEFVQHWNTKARNLRESQMVLSFLFNEMTPSDLEAIPGFSKALEGLLPYTLRHSKRIEALHQASYIVDYIMQCGSIVHLGDSTYEDKQSDEITMLKAIKNEYQIIGSITGAKLIPDRNSESGSDSGSEEMSVDGRNSRMGDDLADNFEMEEINAQSSDESSSNE